MRRCLRHAVPAVLFALFAPAVVTSASAAPRARIVQEAPVNASEPEAKPGGAAGEASGAGNAGEKIEKDDPLATKEGYAQLFVTVMGGTGFRFNNPYRLATPLGDDAESVSRTASYLDVGLAATFGSPLGFQHGGALRTTGALEGVGQIVMTPSYFVWRRVRSLAAYGRAGVPFVLSPDLTWGLEAGIGGAFFFRGGIGVAAEIVGDLFYGAGTRESAIVTYPVLSGQIGFISTLEFLP